MLRNDRIAAHRVLGHITGHGELGLRSNARRQILPLRARTEKGGAIAATANTRRDRRRERFGIVVREARMLEHEDHISASRRELRGLYRNTRRASDHRVHLSTGCISNGASRRHRFESGAADLTTTRLGECKNVCH